MGPMQNRNMEQSIKFCKLKASLTKNHIKSLENKLHNKLANNKHDNEAKDIENELEEIYNRRAIGAQIRSRVKWLEEGEKKNTKYFLNLENNRQTQKSIIKLYDSKGVLLTDQTDILNRQK